MKFSVRKILNGLISIKIYFIFFITLSFAFIFFASVQNAHAAITFDGNNYKCNNARTAVVLQNGKEIPNVAGSQCERLQICDWAEPGKVGCIFRENYCSKNDNCDNDPNNCRLYLGSGVDGYSGSNSKFCKSILDNNKELNQLCSPSFYCYNNEYCYPKNGTDNYCSATPHAIQDGHYCNETPQCSTSSFCDTEINKSKKNTCRPCTDVLGYCDTGVVPPTACTDLIGLFGVTSAKCSTYTPAIDPNWHVITPEKYDCTGSDNCWIYTPSSIAPPVDTPTPTPKSSLCVDQGDNYRCLQSANSEFSLEIGFTCTVGLTCYKKPAGGPSATPTPVRGSPAPPVSTPVPTPAESRKGYCGKEDRITNMKEVNAPLPAGCNPNTAKLDTSLSPDQTSPYCRSQPNRNQAPYFYECVSPSTAPPLTPPTITARLTCEPGGKTVTLAPTFTPSSDAVLVTWIDSISATPIISTSIHYTIDPSNLDGSHSIYFDIYACPAGITNINQANTPHCVKSINGYMYYPGYILKDQADKCAANAVPTATLAPATGKPSTGDYAANGAVCNPARAQLACASSLDVCSIHWDCTRALASQAHGCCTTGRWCPSAGASGTGACVGYGTICNACPVAGTATPTLTAKPLPATPSDCRGGGPYVRCGSSSYGDTVHPCARPGDIVPGGSWQWDGKDAKTSCPSSGSLDYCYICK